MSTTIFRSTSFTLRHLVESIGRGEIALPELQRPFVWANTKVRDLFDSMYRGFPVGYLLFWETGAESGARKIGTNSKDARVARWLIVDGQQRMTSLYSVMTGTPVVREDYTESRIKLAFRPKDGHFAVSDAAVERNPEYLKDITRLWGQFRTTTAEFFENLESARGVLDDSERRRWEDALDRVRDLQNFPFNVLELDDEVDEERVAEIFVRINSEGVKLNQSDFILTLMSVFWDDGRRALEKFSKDSKLPSAREASPFNWHISPSPDQMLRVSIALAFRRAVLRHAYSILRGKDLETGQMSADRRDAQFRRLEAAQEKVLDLTNWHEFLRCVERAGFRGAKMISSQNVLLFTYALWLIGRIDHRVAVAPLREVIARWFFMAHTTSRYSGSFETQAERDFSRIDELAAEIGFVAALNQIIDDTLTDDFWAITLPNELATAASRSPALSAYLAALNVLDAEVLLSTSKVRERLDPALTAKKSVERHHLFPRAYLREVLDIKDTRQINQIANMALVDWNDNIEISDAAPSDYWPQQIASKTYLTESRLSRQEELHALPPNWTVLSYPDFLAQRRKLMAGVARAGFNSIVTGMSPEDVSPPAVKLSSEARDRVVDYVDHVTMADLVEAELVRVGAVMFPADAEIDAIAEISDEALIAINDSVFGDITSAAHAVAGDSPDPWTFWMVETESGPRSLAALRRVYLIENTGDNDDFDVQSAAS